MIPKIEIKWHYLVTLGKINLFELHVWNFVAVTGMRYSLDRS